MITWDDCANYGISRQTGVNADIINNRFLNIVHQTLYDFVLFSSQKSWRRKVIEKYKAELEEPIKDILLSIAFSIDEGGQFNGIWDGVTRLDSGEIKFSDLQERLVAMIPPMAWNQIIGLEPNVLFMGGEI
jgi:hypothetical protein